MAGQENTCWSCGAVWSDPDGRDDEPGGLSGIALLELEDTADIQAVPPSARDVALSGRA